uniref:Putative zinc finger protein NUTCRACKER n=1 Tax=Davidia involucrata TaxID=16924 RepID=A0A5B6YWF7_DAVIN
MFPSNSTSLSEEASISSAGTRVQDHFGSLNPMVSTISPQQHPQKIKKKRNLPGNPDPDAEVIALSPKTLLATNRFVCEICNKGFQRDQNLQLHRRGHNLPWKLKQRNSKENRKRVYVCPEPTCVHHHPSRALGDLTGIKKHFCRKHGEKKWKCEKCSKIYAVQSDWKAHSKTCGTREYRCDCGTLFSRKDSFITHRAFCDALAEESARLSANTLAKTTNPTGQPFHLHSQNPSPLFPAFSTQQQHHFPNPPTHISLNPWYPSQNPNPNPNQNPVHLKPETIHLPIPPPFFQEPPPPPSHKTLITSPFQNLHVSTQPTSNSATSAHLSATALLQKAATVGAQSVGHVASTMTRFDMGEMGTVGHVGTAGISPEYLSFMSGNLATWQKNDRLTRDFLGLTGEGGGRGGRVDVNVNARDLISFTGGGEFPTYDRDQTLLKPQVFGFTQPASETWGNC